MELFGLSIHLLIAGLAAAFLFFLGLTFLFAPAAGLKMTKHTAEDLPTIMAGRYFFFVFALAAVMWKGSPELLAVIFLGLAGVAFFDAAVYASKSKDVRPHLAAGVLALIVPAIMFGGRA